MTVQPKPLPLINPLQVMAKRWQYLASALVSGGLSITFHFRAGPAESLEAMNSTDLMKGMPSLDLLVGYR